MFKYFFVFACAIGILFNTTSAQSLIKLESTEASSEVLPSYQGGDDALYLFIAENLQYPAAAKENNIQGMALVKFTVEIDGRISNLELLEDPGHGCGNAALNVVKMTSGQWNAGTVDGEVKPTGYQLPISFVIPKKRESGEQ